MCGPNSKDQKELGSHVKDYISTIYFYVQVLYMGPMCKLTNVQAYKCTWMDAQVGNNNNMLNPLPTSFIIYMYYRK